MSTNESLSQAKICLVSARHLPFMHGLKMDDENLPAAVMLTALLNFPDPVSHQYTSPLGPLDMLHVNPVNVAV